MVCVQNDGVRVPRPTGESKKDPGRRWVMSSGAEPQKLPKLVVGLCTEIIGGDKPASFQGRSRLPRLDPFCLAACSGLLPSRREPLSSCSLSALSSQDKRGQRAARPGDGVLRSAPKDVAQGLRVTMPRGRTRRQTTAEFVALRSFNMWPPLQGPVFSMKKVGICSLSLVIFFLRRSHERAMETSGTFVKLEKKNRSP